MYSIYVGEDEYGRPLNGITQDDYDYYYALRNEYYEFFIDVNNIGLTDLTDELYESKIVYRTEKFEDNVRTFCMNPYGSVVNENTNGIVTVNGHSFENPEMRTDNTNFALLVSKKFTEPFKEPIQYGQFEMRNRRRLRGH